MQITLCFYVGMPCLRNKLKNEKENDLDELLPKSSMAVKGHMRFVFDKSRGCATCQVFSCLTLTTAL